MSRTACLNAIYKLAKKDERVIFIGSDLSANTLTDFRRDFPDRFFMEGIQEQNIISMAAGLAMEGYIPYVNTIATFLTRRCYEQIAVDICAHNLPVRLIGNGGGLVYAPLGLTHCAIEDIAIMRALPNMNVICCSDNEEMKDFMPQTIENLSPMYIRLGKDSDPILRLAPSMYDPDSICLVGTGIMSAKLMQVQTLMNEWGIGCYVAHISHIKPLRQLRWPLHTKMIVTAEEGIINGGLGSAVLECLADNNIQIPVLRFGLPDVFPHHYGEQEDLLETYGLTPEKMAKRIKDFYQQL